MNKLKTLQIVHLAFCIFPIIFAITAIFINYSEIHFNMVNIQQPLLLIAPIVALISSIGSRLVFNSLINSAKNNLELSDHSKFLQYQTALIVKAAFLEGAALFNIVVFLITSNTFTLFFAFWCIYGLWHRRPTKDRIVEELSLQDTNTLNGI